METLGRKIRIARVKKNMKQVDLAKKLNISQSAVSSWEKDLFAPDGLLLLELIKILGSEILPDEVKEAIELKGEENKRKYATIEEISSIRKEMEELRKSIVIYQNGNNNKGKINQEVSV